MDEVVSAALDEAAASWKPSHETSPRSHRSV
jgi:hypothetical protein